MIEISNPTDLPPVKSTPQECEVAPGQVSPRTFRYGRYFAGKCLLNALINAGINAAFGIVFATDPMPLWGSKGIIADVAGMSFFLCLFLSWFVILEVRDDLKKGRLPAHAGVWGGRPARAIGKLPQHSVLRAAIFATTGMSICTPLAILLFSAQGVESLPYWEFVFFKAGYAALMALLLDPFARLSGLNQTPDDWLIRFLGKK